MEGLLSVFDQWKMGLFWGAPLSPFSTMSHFERKKEIAIGKQGLSPLTKAIITQHHLIHFSGFVLTTFFTAPSTGLPHSTGILQLGKYTFLTPYQEIHCCSTTQKLNVREIGFGTLHHSTWHTKNPILRGEYHVKLECKILLELTKKPALAPAHNNIPHFCWHVSITRAASTADKSSLCPALPALH